MVDFGPRVGDRLSRLLKKASQLWGPVDNQALLGYFSRRKEHNDLQGSVYSKLCLSMHLFGQKSTDHVVALPQSSISS